jgi:hypothetical protein
MVRTATQVRPSGPPGRRLREVELTEEPLASSQFWSILRIENTPVFGLRYATCKCHLLRVIQIAYRKFAYWSQIWRESIYRLYEILGPGTHGTQAKCTISGFQCFLAFKNMLVFQPFRA